MTNHNEPNSLSRPLGASRAQYWSLGATFVGLLTFTALFSTCNSGGGGGGGGRGSSDATALSGTWETACTEDPGKPGYAFVDQRTFDGSTFATEFNSYSDTACSTLVMAQTQAGSFTIGEALEEQDGITPHKLDIVISGIYVTLASDALVRSYNQRNFCGGGWELGAKRQITKKDCAGGATDEDASEDQIFEIFGTDGDQLYFGTKDAAHNGRSDGARPVALELDKLYAK